jgi:hypothetical protein
VRHWEKTRRAAGNNKLARRSKDGILNEGDGGSGRIEEESRMEEMIIKEMVGYSLSPTWTDTEEACADAILGLLLENRAGRQTCSGNEMK